MQDLVHTLGGGVNDLDDFCPTMTPRWAGFRLLHLWRVTQLWACQKTRLNLAKKTRDLTVRVHIPTPRPFQRSTVHFDQSSRRPVSASIGSHSGEALFKSLSCGSFIQQIIPSGSHSYKAMNQLALASQYGQVG